MDYRLSNSRCASKAFCIFSPTELIKWSSGSAYIGRSAVYSIPVFIGADSALNQHVCIIGMSGSGKTFLLKNLVGRYAANGRQVMILDWNSEYSGMVSYFYGIEFNISRNGKMPEHLLHAAKQSDGPDIISINLSSLGTESAKLSAAKAVLKSVRKEFREVPAWESSKKILVLDEAWKVIGGEELSSLFREGRKYGVGVVIASQTASDLNAEILANCATVAVFRLQNADDFSLLLDTHIINQMHANMLATMSRGSCIVAIASAKDRPRQIIRVPLVEGNGYSICYISGENVEVSISIEALMAKLSRIVIDANSLREIESYIAQNGGKINLDGLMRKLLELSTSRSDIVACLRSIGVPDMAIIDSYKRCG